MDETELLASLTLNEASSPQIPDEAETAALDEEEQIEAELDEEEEATKKVKEEKEYKGPQTPEDYISFYVKELMEDEDPVDAMAEAVAYAMSILMVKAEDILSEDNRWFQIATGKALEADLKTATEGYANGCPKLIGIPLEVSKGMPNYEKVQELSTKHAMIRGCRTPGLVFDMMDFYTLVVDKIKLLLTPEKLLEVVTKAENNLTEESKRRLEKREKRIAELEAQLKRPRVEWELHNKWFNHNIGAHIHIMRDKISGKTSHRIVRQTHDRLNFILDTMHASTAWTLKGELSALADLEKMLKPAQFTMYMTTGNFTESSKKSGMYYMFRKCRPTIAARLDSSSRIIHAVGLCGHPLAYYQGTYAGALPPTCDVIAHLLMMRNDEHRLWKKCNHHPLYLSNSGV